MIVTLTTDFGLHDPYVGIMKGVLLGINPGLTVVDLCHTIPPQSVRQAAFQLLLTYRYFPGDTIHLVVVDPGVGTRRAILLVTSNEGRFIAPDNGAISYVLENLSNVSLYRLTNQRYWLSPLSSTFHGRDIIAPVAAHLSLGVPPAELGEPMSKPRSFTLPRPYRHKRGTLIGEVIYIDGFGNLITNVKDTDLVEPVKTIEIAGKVIPKLSRSYAGGQRLTALIDSGGFLEIAVKNGNAAKELEVSTGTQVVIRFAR
ncbi:MAG: SAM-dependent chlorinase/fluorinase [Dehalococcoidia bacterium]|nr:SAM-dependent chlorinase/fluorinase [Dehalococcoidia bacterium]